LKTKSLKDSYTVADLQDWDKATRGISPRIRLAVLGDPVGHSLSPEIQNAALRESGIEMQYVRWHVGTDELEQALEFLRDNEFVGVNLTLPHKERALTFIDDHDTEGGEVGAVNTIAVRDGKLIGFNTDGVGFSRAIREEFFVDLRDLRVLVLGAGGAARAIVFECARQHCERLVIVNRTAKRAEALTSSLQSYFSGPRVLGPVARLQAIAWDEAALSFQIANSDLVVNATPLGINRSDLSPLPTRLLAPHLMVYDTVYVGGGSHTPLVVAAIEAGARAADGLSMLLHQGARSFEIWFGRSAPIEAMRQALR
jgi:shikimate dehydrogenase